MIEPNPDTSEINDAARRLTGSSEYIEPKTTGSLSESLYQFAHTPLEKLIHEKLTENGINPKTYNTWDDLNYAGLPISTGKADSFVVKIVDDEINAGNILAIPNTISRVRETGRDRWASPGQGVNTYQLRHEPQATSRLSKILIGFSNEVLVDPRSREIVGYTLDLSGDGGKKGFALASSDILEPVSQDTGEVLTAEDIIQLEEERRTRMNEPPLFA